MSMSLDLDTLKSFGQIAAPAGLAIGAFLYIARDIIAKIRGQSVVFFAYD